MDKCRELKYQAYCYSEDSEKLKLKLFSTTLSKKKILLSLILTECDAIISNWRILSTGVRFSGTERPRLFRFWVRTVAFACSFWTISSVIPACSTGCAATPFASAAID